ncbi:MAG: phosphoribosylformylglycinamidine synthase subunit PurS [candidate division KSB1 bacterium]|nr:phosphoribosylformylglycinamidine synthase subunit PurS [candidate division KSB1 bacterium]
MPKSIAAYAARLEEDTVRARVFVMPKKEVLDPQGKAVARSLHALGFSEVSDVRIGKLIELDLDTDDRQRAAERTEAMCRKLLANGVIEDFSFQLEE